MNKRSLLIPLVIICFILILVPAALYAQEEIPECAHPRVTYLTKKTGASCQEILDLVAAEVGYGQIMKSVVIAEGLPGYNGDWRTLLDSHRQGQGWGEVTHAYGLSSRFTDLGLSGESLLTLKESGLGWGPIIHAQSLATADIGVSFDEAVGLLQAGLGWGEIRDELSLPPGPPPWASAGNSDDGNGPGNSDNARGAGNSDDESRPGNSDNAKGAGNSDNGNGPGNSDNAKGAGNSDDESGPGNSDNAKGAGNSDNGNRPDNGNNGNGPGISDNGGSESELKFTGSVEVISETLWIIDGETITIVPETKIEAGIEVGDLVEVEVWLADGSSPTAQEIRLVDRDGTDEANGNE